MEGHVVKIVFRIKFLLPAFYIKILAKVSLAVKKSDTDKRYSEIAGRFQMVAGRNGAG
jgi:hypothetical protein